MITRVECVDEDGRRETLSNDSSVSVSRSHALLGYGSVYRWGYSGNGLGFFTGRRQALGGAMRYYVIVIEYPDKTEIKQTLERMQEVLDVVKEAVLNNRPKVCVSTREDRHHTIG